MVDQAEIHRKSLSDNAEDRREAAQEIRINFKSLSDKGAAWKDLHRLTFDHDTFVRFEAFGALGPSYPHIPDKDEAWKDLMRLTGDDNLYVRSEAFDAVGAAFPHVPDKDAAWLDLIWLSGHDDSSVRSVVFNVLYTATLYISNKDAIYQDLIRLTGAEDRFVRYWAASALEAYSPRVPDKDVVSQHLIRLTRDKEYFVRTWAVSALGDAFTHVPNKDEAWQNLHCLIGDKYGGVRSEVAYTICSAFPHIPNKDAAWQDLVLLTCDEESYVRVAANYSLGKASIFKATETKCEEDFRREMENALQYFENSVVEPSFSNPARFCLPFYRSFYFLTCKSENSEAEVEKYMKEAKEASGGSKSKEDLLEAVENLSNALKETRNLRDGGFEAAKRDLKSYRQYCDRAAELLDETEERAPGATKIIRKGLPIIDRQIKETIGEIQKSAKAICLQTRGTGTPFESLGSEINQWAGELSEDYLKSERSASRIAAILRTMCKLLPADERCHACEIVAEITDETEIGNKLSKIELALTYIQPNIKIALRDEKSDQIIAKLGELKYDLKELSTTLLNRLDENEKIIISTILDQSDQEQMDEMLDLVKQVLSEVQHQELRSPITSYDVEQSLKVVDDTKLKAADKLKFILPLIFFQYEHEITLEKGVNLSAAWDRLVGRAKGKR